MTATLNGGGARSRAIAGTIPTRKFAGLDLGQVSDYTAMAIVERPILSATYTQPVVYQCRYLCRWQLGTPYPKIVDEVTTMLHRPEVGRCSLSVDATGVGRPVVDLFRAKGSITAITITSGHTATQVPGGWHVPKKELAGTIQALLQTDKLLIAAGLPQAAVLIEELKTFKVKITTAGNEVFESWRDRDHDDLVLALAIACWMGRKAEASERRPVDDEPLVFRT
jgi:hypothetical protein